MTTLHTRLHGRRAALSLIPTGFGPSTWIGELRDASGEPVLSHVEDNPMNRLAYEVRVAPDLGSLLQVLVHRAESAPL